MECAVAMSNIVAHAATLERRFTSQIRGASACAKLTNLALEGLLPPEPAATWYVYL